MSTDDTNVMYHNRHYPDLGFCPSLMFFFCCYLKMMHYFHQNKFIALERPICVFIQESYQTSGIIFNIKKQNHVSLLPGLRLTRQ